MKITMMKDVPLDEFKEILPTIRHRWIVDVMPTISEIVTLSAEDEDGSIMGFVPFVIQKNSRTCVILYVSVLEQYRGNGVGTALVKGAVDQIRKWGYEKVYFTAVDGDDTRFFTRMGFSKFKKEIVLIYKGDILKSSKIGKNIEKLNPYRKNVKKLLELSPTAKENFGKLLLDTSFTIDIDKLDPFLTRFYVDEKGEVVGYMYIVRGDDGTYTNEDIYVKNGKYASIALPCMMVSFLYEEMDRIHDDTKVIITLSSENNAQAMEQSFGIPTQKVQTTYYGI